MSDDFVLVTKKSSKKSRKTGKNQFERSSSPIIIDENRVYNQIRDIKTDLETSEFISKSGKILLKAIENKVISEIICLGIGKISECVIAKHQLAFILIVKEQLKFQNKIKFYDPVLTKSDKNLLERFESEILIENKEGKYCAAHPTLFYLPHCPKQITNNLVFSNWTSENIQNLVLICNSFKTIIESTPERFLRPSAHYLLESSSFVCEYPLDNCFKFSDIFNDFSIHTFFQHHNVGKEIWNNHPEPNYLSEDLEFIRNNGNSSS